MSRIEKLKEYMKECSIDACIIPTADPHLSEYLSDYYKLRQYLCGFTGSAGTLVVTQGKCGLWTDGRYYIQAEKELSGSGVDLYKASEKDCIKIHEFIKENLKEENIAGVDASLFSKKQLDTIISELEKGKIRVNTDFTPEKVWEERPEKNTEKAFLLDEKFCGESAVKKLARVRAIMKKEGFSHYLISAPECIMWLLNIRGNDVKHTPVMLSYLLVSKNGAFLYADYQKIDEEVSAYLKKCNVEQKNYDSIYEDLAKIDGGAFLATDFTLTNYKLIKTLSCAYKDRKDFILNMKCIKNEKEIENIKNAYIKENTALVKSFYEIYNTRHLDECDAADIIEKHRKKAEGYYSPSFDTIAAFGKNAAMMHYCAKENACAEIEKNGMLLIDTGGQYFEGTTDTTRTLVMGEISEEERKNLTLVLKGNISLALSVFPEGSTGRDIDAIARMPLWKKGLDYRCGTGHGVGYFLGVHEGPQRISPLCNDKLLPGMTVTDEPGVYVENKYGIRIENHLCVREHSDTEYGKFFCFEVLNYCPIGTKALIPELLDDEQKIWLNSYNERCRQLLSDYLSVEESAWLKTYTQPI